MWCKWLYEVVDLSGAGDYLAFGVHSYILSMFMLICTYHSDLEILCYQIPSA